ncbi:hypothetical protein EDB87DRAFT_1623606 [Lactarius vividus]|nr:hypothetical protein EDB87DRAFT_1623606 [Lactarius vividus]
MHWLCFEAWCLALPIPHASSLVPCQPPIVLQPINTSQEYITPSSALLLVLFPFDSVVPLPLQIFPIPSSEIPKAFQVGTIGMSPAGDNEQSFRECKGSLEGICLMRNEKADWSLQRQALDQSYPGRQVATTEFTEIQGRDEYIDARDGQIVPDNPLREFHAGLVPAGVRVVDMARAATPPGTSTTIRGTGSSTDAPDDRIMNHNFPHSPLYLFLPRLFSTRGEGSDYLAARRCDYHDP